MTIIITCPLTARTSIPALLPSFLSSSHTRQPTALVLLSALDASTPTMLNSQHNDPTRSESPRKACKTCKRLAIREPSNYVNCRPCRKQATRKRENEKFQQELLAKVAQSAVNDQRPLLQPLKWVGQPGSSNYPKERTQRQEENSPSNASPEVPKTQTQDIVPLASGESLILPSEASQMLC